MATETVPNIETAFERASAVDLVNLASSLAQKSAPMASIIVETQYPLVYYASFFMDAELPFPLAFQNRRSLNIPSPHGDGEFTQLPEGVVDKLINLYLDRILPQYPIFSRHEISGMFERFKISCPDHLASMNEEGFMVYMCLAIATLSCKSKDYRKLVAVGESLRRDAFSCLDLSTTSNNATSTTIQQLLLLAQYGFLLPSTVNLWQIVGDASMIALENGLHHETTLGTGISEQSSEERKRLYWTVSILTSILIVPSLLVAHKF
ncbi:fungal-specific transcription factor domain-containing protein [Penicillium angulare]|uniref:Fungal-specific transcription factor domain-containing protein n=1 Tax=Penicillium angulare TaxID=116970 RepID=A0A9W9FHF7_9EURO|nr:fungal-specific transcription factor domain-containing protein [Penicillium angulare]